MDRLETVLVAACALVDPDGRVLIAQRPPGKSMAGLWEFPGGKVESGETPEETVIRELEEELGHQYQNRLPGAADIRQPQLRRFSPADAVVHLPHGSGACLSRAKDRRSNGCDRETCATIRCRPRTSRWCPS